MKTIATVLFLMFLGIATSAWTQSGSAAKGQALVESNSCALCHKAGSELGKPLEMLALIDSDARLKAAITHPKETLGPQVKMPEFQFTDAQLQDIIAYLRSIAKR